MISRRARPAVIRRRLASSGGRRPRIRRANCARHARSIVTLRRLRDASASHPRPRAGRTCILRRSSRHKDRHQRCSCEAFKEDFHFRLHRQVHASVGARALTRQIAADTPEGFFREGGRAPPNPHRSDLMIAATGPKGRHRKQSERHPVSYAPPGLDEI